MIKFSQNAWLERYIDMNTNLRKKKDFKKDFFKLMNIAVFRKTIENVRKYSDVKLVRAETYHTTKIFTEHLFVTEMQKRSYL